MEQSINTFSLTYSRIMLAVNKCSAYFKNYFPKEKMVEQPLEYGSRHLISSQEWKRASVGM